MRERKRKERERERERERLCEPWKHSKRPARSD